MTTLNKAIKSYILDNQYLFVHKDGIAESNFGMDNTPELIENGFGLYSSANVKNTIGPLKSQFFRIGFCRQGSLEVDFGLETFTHIKDTIHFNFPGQLFSMKNLSRDMYSVYILFSPEFIEPLASAPQLQSGFPFFEYGGIPFFKLSETEAGRIENLFLQIDSEIKSNFPFKGTAIRHLLMLVLLEAKRSYNRQGLAIAFNNGKASSLLVRFKKLVAQHFINIRTVADYANKLSVSAKHLSKVIKDETDRTPSDFIDEMLMMEIKALLRHSELSISEIAYQLHFSDPSHLTTFFKKHQGVSPLKFRKEV